MTNCSEDLRLYDSQVQTCEFSPSSGSDVHNYWYYPFSADGSGTGHSSAYKIPVTAGVDPPTTISRGDFSNSPPTVTCADNARTKPMCVKVQGPRVNRVQTQLADSTDPAFRPGDFSDGIPYDVGNCTGDGKRWISTASAFAPPGDPQGRTTYEVRGCALDCAEPNFADLNMDKLTGDNPSSGADFSVQFKCASGYGPPLQVSPAVLTDAERGNMVGDTGMPATKCTAEGGIYALNYTDVQGNDVVAPACVQDCTLPSDATQYPGYDLTATASNLAGINLGLSLDVSSVSRHLTCAADYTLRSGDAVAACSAAGDPIVINDENSGLANGGGCVSDCKADPESQAFNWLPNGDRDTRDSTHDFYSSGARYIWQDPTSAQPGGPQLSASSDPGAPSILSCPRGYEPGPGADIVSGGPTYEPCGYLPGKTSSMGVYSIFTRSTYGLTGCYPHCDPSTDLCYNYKTEREYSVGPGSYGSDEPPEVTWRDQMGQMLTDATTGASDTQSPLGASNISFVRRQVLNNGPDVGMGKEIFEWQIKCSNQNCTNDAADSDKININDILGPDGIPTPVIPGVPGFYFADDGQSCDDACSVKQNLVCDPTFTVSDIVDPNDDSISPGSQAFASLVSSSGIGSGNAAACANGEVGAAVPAYNASAPYFVYNADMSSCFVPQTTVGGNETISCSSTISNPPNNDRSYETHNRLCKCVPN